MAYTVLSGNAGGVRARSLGRGAPAFGGHRPFAGVHQKYRSIYMPGSNGLGHASGVDVATIHGEGATYSRMSLMAWWYVPANITPAQQNGIVGASTVITSNGFGLMFQSANTVKMWVASHATAANNATSAAITGAVGTWHFTVGTWDASAAIMRIFVDGGTSAADTGTLAVAQSYPSAPLELGRSASGSQTAAQYFQGYLGDVAFWDRALTSGEVTTLYNSGTPYDISGDAGILSGLRAWYRPGNGRGDSDYKQRISDLSGNGFHMAISGVAPLEVFAPRFVPFSLP